MIYQHRQVIAREGRLEQRHRAFQDTALSALDDHGSTLIAAWEVWTGADADCAVYQMRQFDSLADWEGHQQRVSADTVMAASRQATLSPVLDQVDTAIVRMAAGIPALPRDWPEIATVRGTPRGFFEQRILRFKPGTAAAHHALYQAEVIPALTRCGGELMGLFDTVIGPGTMNASSHRSIEVRRFADLQCWQDWRNDQDHVPELRELMKERYITLVAQLDSVLMRPLDYSRVR
jgi:hypothetical protein